MEYTDDYFLYDNCCLRIPSQPVDRLLDFNAKFNNIELDDHEEIVQILKDFFSDPFYQEAVYIASPDLWDTFIDLRNTDFSKKDATKRFVITFYKYLSRMTTRATPYGLFSGVASARLLEEPTNIKFERSKYKISCQLNIHKVIQLIRNINPLHVQTIHKIKYYINNTLYILGDKAYYVEQFDNGRYIASNLTSVRLSEYVKVILDCARNGATVNEMSAKISNPNISEEKKLHFIKNIIHSQIIVSELMPSVSTENFIKDLLDIVQERNIDLEEIKKIRRANDIIKNISDIHSLREYIKNNSGDLVLKDFYKLDLFYNLKENKINKNIINEISSISYELMHLFTPKTSLALKNFVKSYSERYEEREMPLIQVLDTNYGIGYEKVVTGNAEYTPLLEGIPLFPNPKNESKLIYNAFERMVDEIFKKFNQDRLSIINADNYISDYLNNNLSNTSRVPSSYIFGRILSDSSDSLDSGDYKFYPIQCHAPFATRLLTRFTHGDDALKKAVNKMAYDEQKANPDVVLAEVLTIPDDDYANITLSSTIRDYEIPFLSKSNLEKKYQINSTDILVSVRNGKVILKSRSMNKEIIPFLSNTYNTILAQPLYKFLADVGSQDIRLGYFWDWGRYINETFLPRIEYKKFIISRARWLIKQEKTDYKNDSALEKGISKLKKRYNLSQYAVMTVGDNELLLDLKNKVCQFILLKEVNRYDVVLYENIHTKETCFIEEDGNKFTNEIVIALGSHRPIYTPKKALPSALQKSLTRVFPPGSEWLYIKIYSGSKNVEDILIHVIGDFAAELINKKIIDKWFFIKYNDPEHHIRVRFHCTEPTNKSHEWYLITEQLQNLINAFIVEEQAIKITVDTYFREMERYGEETIELSEDLFFHDSIAVTEFLSLIDGNEGEILRWKFALIDIDVLLDDFDYDLKDKLRILSIMESNFIKEFSYDNHDYRLILARSLSSKYRNLRKDISKILSDEEDEYKELYDCFKKRSESNQISLKKYHDIPVETKDSLMISYIHMTLNRLLLVNQRRHEVILYYFLKKYYESTNARAKNTLIL